ncbi:DMT family transporter [Azoarcus sp. L1K30]|uniref:DMT family transporter n=1 Tax=Azoarcus sp. L1K30 TaxID=2820277 RepID=UPI001B81D766|nr:DMT family transporter [Azoarcus sp. L1K30]MBR0564788.1 DMT family transporter [Azoarcus sp. L1K30]
MQTISGTPVAGRWAAVAQSPSVLLVVTGTLIGLNFPLGKLGGQAGVSPAMWALLISFGASAALLPVLWLRGRLRWPSVRILRYSVISSLVSFVGPNLLLFSVMPHAGAGYTGLMFALSPVVTVLFAGLCRLRTPGRLGLLGVAVGLVGAVVVNVSRGGDAAGPSAYWLMLALLIPVSLAGGNVYRTLAWPPDAAPNVLAFWGQVCSSVVFVAVLMATEGRIPVADVVPAGGAAVGQLVVAAMTFPAVFRLQQRGGPVLFSQIGYVAAAVGLIVATIALGERYATLTWVGAGVIGAGIGITVLSQWRDGRVLTAPSAAGPGSVRS